MCVPYHSRALWFLSRILGAETDVPSLALSVTLWGLSPCLVLSPFSPLSLSLSGPFYFTSLSLLLQASNTALHNTTLLSLSLSLSLSAPWFSLSLCFKNPPLLQLVPLFHGPDLIAYLSLVSHTDPQ